MKKWYTLDGSGPKRKCKVWEVTQRVKYLLILSTCQKYPCVHVLCIVTTIMRDVLTTFMLESIFLFLRNWMLPSVFWIRCDKYMTSPGAPGSSFSLFFGVHSELPRQETPVWNIETLFYGEQIMIYCDWCCISFYFRRFTGDKFCRSSQSVWPRQGAYFKSSLGMVQIMQVEHGSFRAPGSLKAPQEVVKPSQKKKRPRSIAKKEMEDCNRKLPSMVVFTKNYAIATWDPLSAGRGRLQTNGVHNSTAFI